MRIPFDTLFQQLKKVLLQYHFSEERAALCARLFAEASRDGVYTHGLNRFPRFIKNIQQGTVQAEAVPERLQALGPMEQWDGQRGPGNLNAHFCMNRAITLADMVGRLPKQAVSAFAGPTLNPICLPGVRWTRCWATTPSSSLFPGKRDILCWIRP